MPDWLGATLREFGLGNVIVLAIGVGAAVIWRSAWPFFVKEVWPEIKLVWQFQRTAKQSQSEKLTALYDVLIQVNSDNIKSNAQTVAALKEIQGAFKESVTMLETASNNRHDELVTMITQLIEQIRNYTDVSGQLIQQWQRFIVPPFIEERRHSDESFAGPERRQP